jgi:tRNA A37 threonylcarbamoyladenosine biosynthesis protein TsaE
MVREHTSSNALGIETLHHCDVYRVESLDEVLDLALGELVEDSAVALVEWGELAASVFGRDVMTVDFRVDDDDGRTLTVDGELAATRGAQLDRWAS